MLGSNPAPLFGARFAARNDLGSQGVRRNDSHCNEFACPGRPWPLHRYLGVAIVAKRATKKSISRTRRWGGLVGLCCVISDLAGEAGDGWVGGSSAPETRKVAWPHPFVRLLAFRMLFSVAYHLKH